jgi:hypothetical protein
MRGAWTAREVLQRVVTDEDADRFKRFLRIVEERKPDIKKELGYAQEILSKARGKRLSDVLNE